MPTMQCPGCGKAVRFEGVAGVCPNCATIVRAPRSGGTAAAGRRPAGTGKTPPASDLGSADQDEVFSPTGGGGGGSGMSQLDPRLLWGIVAAVVLVGGFGLFEVFHTPAPSIQVAGNNPAPVPAPPAYVPPATPVAPPPPPAVVTRAVPTTGATTRPAEVVLPDWYGLRPAVPTLPREKINDRLVEQALQRGAAFLKPLCAGSGLPADGTSPEWHGGADSLITYSLLHAGEALSDPELAASGPLLSAALTRMKAAPPDPTTSTYFYSVEAQALGLVNREADRPDLERAAQWLLRAQVGGAYGYVMPPKADPASASPVQWDGSNSQYGVLGVWAASEAGVAAPASYWQEVERHWLSVQNKDGSWGYHLGDSSAAMTAAGITTLSVAAEQEVVITGGTGKDRAAPSDGEGSGGGGSGRASSGTKGNRRGATRLPPPVAIDPASLSAAIDHGLSYLDQEDRLLAGGLDSGYSLYGIERAALATGFRYFGPHDWYRELGAREIANQSPEGSWGGYFGVPINTAFRLLFLARGRQPLLMDKLRFTGDWNDRPRDVAKLTSYVSAQLEKPFAWGVAELDRDWSDWLDAPLLFISTDEPPTFTDDDCHKLRSYSDAGGFILLHNEFGSADVDAFAADLAKRVWPEYPLAAVPPGDLLYHDVFSMTGTAKRPLPPLKEVSNGTRPLLVYSPTDVTKAWVAWRSKDSKTIPNMELGLNLFVAAAGKADFRNRLNSPYVGLPAVKEVGTLPVQQVTYAGGQCDPEPGAWVRFPRWFLDHTSVALDVRPTAIKAVDVHASPLAVLTGNRAVDFSQMDLHALGAFVHAGGTLLVDADGGSKAFAQSVHERLLPGAFGGASSTGLPLEHPILAGTGPCMTPLPKPRLRKYASEQLGMGVTPGVQYLTYGSGTVIVSDLDLTTALLHSGTYGIMGYAPDYAQDLVKNVVLYTAGRFQPPTPTAAPTEH